MTGPMLETIGSYAIKDQVSRGDRGTTTVYRAWDEGRERQVALKVLVPELLEDLDPEEVQTRLRRAAETSSFLNHAAIARVRDVGQDQGFHFVSSDYVEGVSAFDLVAEHGPMPMPEALRIVMDLAAGLGYAHSQGVVHGDVKLENVMLRRDGSAVLTDYGSLHDFAPEGSPVEERWATSITSLSPEQIQGLEAGPASDLYGLAVVLFELLTGDSAFPVREGEDPWEAARRRVEKPPPRIPDPVRDVPRDFDGFFERALARDPQSRFESAGDTTRALIALAVRYRLDIPDAVPLETIPERYVASRQALQEALHSQTEGVQVPREPEGDMGEKTRLGVLRRRQQGWLSLTACTLLLVAVWWGLTTQVAYLSVSSFPPGAELTLISPDGSERELGLAPVAMCGVRLGPERLRLRWAGTGATREVPLEGLGPRTHLQIDASPEAASIRRIQISLPSWFRGAPGGEGPLQLRSEAVDSEGDRLLLEKKLEEAARIYQSLVQEDPARRRQAADRLVEVAYLRRHSDPDWAREAYRKAVRLDGDHGRGHVLLGELLRGQGDPKALFHFHKGGQRLAPGRPPGLPEGPGQALDEVRRVREERPGDPLLWRWEGHLLRQAGKTEEALEVYRTLARDRGWDRPDQY